MRIKELQKHQEEQRLRNEEYKRLKETLNENELIVREVQEECLRMKQKIKDDQEAHFRDMRNM